MKLKDNQTLKIKQFHRSVIFVLVTNTAKGDLAVQWIENRQLNLHLLRIILEDLRLRAKELEYAAMYSMGNKKLYELAVAQYNGIQ